MSKEGERERGGEGESEIDREANWKVYYQTNKHNIIIQIYESRCSKSWP